MLRWRLNSRLCWDLRTEEKSWDSPRWLWHGWSKWHGWSRWHVPDKAQLWWWMMLCRPVLFILVARSVLGVRSDRHTWTWGLSSAVGTSQPVVQPGGVSGSRIAGLVPNLFLFSCWFCVSSCNVMLGRIEAASRSCKHIECPLVSLRWCLWFLSAVVHGQGSTWQKAVCWRGGGTVCPWAWGQPHSLDLSPERGWSFGSGI